MGDTASTLGNAMDELMRHQPSLKESATAAIIQLLEELCALGRDPKYVCWKAQAKPEAAPPIEVRKPTFNIFYVSNFYSMHLLNIQQSVTVIQSLSLHERNTVIGPLVNLFKLFCSASALIK